MSIAREISDFINRNVKDKDLSSLFDGTFPLDSAEANFLKDKLKSDKAIDAEGLLLMALQVVMINKSGKNPGIDKVSFVATLPGMKIPEVQGTFAAIDILLRNATSEVIAFGYEINDKDIIRLIHKCCKKNLQVCIACDKERGTGEALITRWPSDVPRADIYIHQVQDLGAPYPKMHSKLLLIDGCKLLITSANFTFHGMEGNLELGVLIEGKTVRDLREVLIYILNSKAFVKEIVEE